LFSHVSLPSSSRFSKWHKASMIRPLCRTPKYLYVHGGQSMCQSNDTAESSYHDDDMAMAGRKNNKMIVGV
jgi:hypothetical protein